MPPHPERVRRNYGSSVSYAGTWKANENEREKFYRQLYQGSFSIEVFHVISKRLEFAAVTVGTGWNCKFKDGDGVYVAGHYTRLIAGDIVIYDRDTVVRVVNHETFEREYDKK